MLILVNSIVYGSANGKKNSQFRLKSRKKACFGPSEVLVLVV